MKSDTSPCSQGSEDSNLDSKEPVIIDKSMMGHDGIPRIYQKNCPTITQRIYKEPCLVVQNNPMLYQIPHGTNMGGMKKTIMERNLMKDDSNVLLDSYTKSYNYRVITMRQNTSHTGRSSK